MKRLLLILILAGCGAPERDICKEPRWDGRRSQGETSLMDTIQNNYIDEVRSKMDSFERRLNKVDPTPTPSPTPSRRCCCDWLDCDYSKGTAGPDFDDGRKKCQDDYMCTHYSICDGCKW